MFFLNKIQICPRWSYLGNYIKQIRKLMVPLPVVLDGLDKGKYPNLPNFSRLLNRWHKEIIHDNYKPT